MSWYRVWSWVRVRALALGWCSFVCLLFACGSVEAQPAGICTATVLNRTTALGPGGTVAIPNVPYEAGYFRVRVTCTDGGVTTRGQTAFFLLNPNGRTIIP